MKPVTPKPVVWMGDSLAVIQEFPKAVRREVGYAVYLAQTGGRHPNSKPLKGLGSGVVEVVSDHRGDAYRAVYTVRLAGKVYVLHAFRKKSTKGVATPKFQLDLVRHRLKRAIELHTRQES